MADHRNLDGLLAGAGVRVRDQRFIAKHCRRCSARERIALIRAGLRGLWQPGFHFVPERYNSERFYTKLWVKSRYWRLGVMARTE